MSQSNLETVRRIYEGWGQGDFTAGVDLYDRHVLLVLRPEFPEAGTYCGLDEIRRYMRAMFLAWGRYVIEGEEFTEAGDSVLVSVRQHGLGKGSGAAVDMRYFQVWTFRGGKVIRIESIMERRDALRAVGLE